MSDNRLFEIDRLSALARKARRRGDAATAARWYRAGILLLQYDALITASRDDLARRLNDLIERQEAAEKKRRPRQPTIEEYLAGLEDDDPIGTGGRYTGEDTPQC